MVISTIVVGEILQREKFDAVILKVERISKVVRKSCRVVLHQPVKVMEDSNILLTRIISEGRGK